MVFFCCFNGSFPVFPRRICCTPTHTLWAQKKPRCYIGRGGKVRTCPKGRCKLGNDQELFCGQKIGRRITQKTITLWFPRARRQMNGRKHDDRLLLAATRLSHRSGKNFFFASLSRFTFPLFPLALPALSSSLLFP